MKETRSDNAQSLVLALLLHLLIFGKGQIGLGFKEIRRQPMQANHTTPLLCRSLILLLVGYTSLDIPKIRNHPAI